MICCTTNVMSAVKGFFPTRQIEQKCKINTAARLRLTFVAATHNSGIMAVGAALNHGAAAACARDDRSRDETLRVRTRSSSFAFSLRRRPSDLSRSLSWFSPSVPSSLLTIHTSVTSPSSRGITASVAVKDHTVKHPPQFNHRADCTPTALRHPPQSS